MLSCKIFWTPYTDINDVYEKLKEIRGRKYVYKRFSTLYRTVELSAKFLRVERAGEDSSIVQGTFAFEKLIRDFDLTNDTPIDKPLTISADFALVPFRDRIVLFIFKSEAEDILRIELEKKILGSAIYKTSIIYITNEQMSKIINHINHVSVSSTLDKIDGINGWSTIVVKGPDVRRTSLYERFKERSKEPEKNYRYKDLRNGYKFQISRDLRKGTTITCWKLNPNFVDELYLVKYVLDNILSIAYP